MTASRFLALVALVVGVVAFTAVDAQQAGPPVAPPVPSPTVQGVGTVTGQPGAGGQRQAAPPKPATITDPQGHIVTSEKQKFKVEVVAKDLETPWGLAFLPDGRL